MLRFGVRAFPFDFGPRIAGIDLDMFDGHTWYDLDPASSTAAVFELEQDLVFDLDVPGKVVFPGLDHRARGRNGISAALQLDAVEVRPVGHVVGGIALALEK